MHVLHEVSLSNDDVTPWTWQKRVLSAWLLAVWASLSAQPGSVPGHAAALSAAAQAVLGRFGLALPPDFGLLQAVLEPVLADAD